LVTILEFLVTTRKLYIFFTCILKAPIFINYGFNLVCDFWFLIGGVTSMDPFLLKFFPSVYRKKHADTSTNQYCQYDSETLTMFTSSLYLAALLSSIVAATVTRKFGRKLSMFFGGVLFCVGAILNGFAKAVWMLIVGRMLLGFGIGFANQVIVLSLNLCFGFGSRFFGYSFVLFLSSNIICR
jgi:MFS family permease